MKELSLNQNFKLDKETQKMCLEYSEYPEELEELLKHLEISVAVRRIQKSTFASKLFEILCEVTITRGINLIRFEYHASHADAVEVYEIGMGIAKKNQKFYKSLQYSILCSCSCEYSRAESFKDFCGDYGYDDTLIASKKTYKAIKKQTKKLSKIFSEDEIDYLPR